MAKVKDILNSVRNPFNDPVVKTNTMLSSTIDALSGNNELARTIISDGSVDQPRKARMKGADNDVIESLAKMQIGGFCDFNTKMGEFMERLMRINLNEHNITLDETGFDAHRFGESDSLNYDITKSYSYTKNNNYIEDFVKQVKKDEANGIDATQKIAADGVYMKTTNMYPDDITGAGSGDFRSYEKWAVKNKNSILYKTKQLFRQKKINTIISKFGTNADGLSNDILYKGSNRTAYGESHGRNLLTKDAENGGGNYNINGYNNPYCRVWTHHYKYDRLNKTIRPLSGDGTLGNFHMWGNGFEDKGALQGHYVGKGKPILNIYKSEGTGKFGLNDIISEVTTVGYDKPVNGNWKGDPNLGWRYSVLDTSKGGDGLLKITPKFSKGNTESNIHAKDCMFSIENLAWKGYDPYSFENALSWEQRGPLGGRIMWFPPYGIEFNESTNVNWSRNSFIGRGEDVYTYVNTQRTGNLSFLMVVDHPSIIDYATWNTNAPQPSETDMLRFFAGCDDGDGSDSLTAYVQATPLTDEGVNVNGDKEIHKPIKEEAPQPGDKGADTDKTNITVKVMAFFPNNYSGAYDDWAYTFGYLLLGKNTWTSFEQRYDGTNFIYIQNDSFKEICYKDWNWNGNTRIETERTLEVDFKKVLLDGNYELFANSMQKKDENGNWVTIEWTEAWGNRGYECNLKSGLTVNLEEHCKGTDNSEMPCDGMIYAYKTSTFAAAYNQFIKDKKKGVAWHYRVDGDYTENNESSNTFHQRIPDPNGKNIQPNENYKDKTNYKLNLNASSWTETFGGKSQSGSGAVTGATGSTISGSSESSSSGSDSSGDGYVNEQDRDAAFWEKYTDDNKIDLSTLDGIKSFLIDENQKFESGKKYKFLADSGNSTDVAEITLKNRVCEDFNDIRKFGKTAVLGNFGYVQVLPTIRKEETLNQIKANIMSLDLSETDTTNDPNKWKKYSSDRFDEKSSKDMNYKTAINDIKTSYDDNCKVEIGEKQKNGDDIFYVVKFNDDEHNDEYRIFVDKDDNVKVVHKMLSESNVLKSYPYEFCVISFYVKMHDPINFAKEKYVYLKTENNVTDENTNGRSLRNVDWDGLAQKMSSYIPDVDSYLDIDYNEEWEQGIKDMLRSQYNKTNKTTEEGQSTKEAIIYLSLNDFVAAMDKGLFKSEEATNNRYPGKKATVTLPGGKVVEQDLNGALSTVTKVETQLNKNNYFYNRSENKIGVKKAWELFTDGKLVSVDCTGYSNSHGIQTTGSKSNNPHLATMRATRLGELIEARFGVKANISSESAKAVTGQDHNSKEAKLWRSAVATLKFEVAKKDDVHSSQSKADEDDLPLLTWEQVEAEMAKDQSTPTTENTETPQSGSKLMLYKGGDTNRDTCSVLEWPLGKWINRSDTGGKMFGPYYIKKLDNLEAALQRITVFGGLYYRYQNATTEVRFKKADTLSNGCMILKFDARAKGMISTAGACYEVNLRIDGTLVGKRYINYVSVRIKPGQLYGEYKETFTTKPGANNRMVEEGKRELSKEVKKLFAMFYNNSYMRYAPPSGKKNTELWNQPLDGAWLQKKTNKPKTNTTETNIKNNSNKPDSGSGGGNNTDSGSGGGGSTGGATPESPNNQKPDATPVSNTPNVDENKKLLDMQKRAAREAEWAAQKLRNMQMARDSYRQEGNKIVKEDVLTRVSPNYMLRATREGKGDKNVLRYDQEYYFFKSLEKKDKIVYDKLMDKIKYFDPAFHSMTPEGFNARLTFLNQCTRQGNTISISDKNTTDAGAVDRSVKTANNLAFGRPPYCVLRLGDFYNQMIVINSINIDYSVSDGIQWDMNTEGIGMQPLLARVSISFNFIGGSDMAGPVRRLQNAMTFNYYANARYYDNRADRMAYPANNNTLEMGAVEYNVDKNNSVAYVTAMRK